MELKIPTMVGYGGWLIVVVVMATKRHPEKETTLVVAFGECSLASGFAFV